MRTVISFCTGAGAPSRPSPSSPNSLPLPSAHKHRRGARSPARAVGDRDRVNFGSRYQPDIPRHSLTCHAAWKRCAFSARAAVPVATTPGRRFAPDARHGRNGRREEAVASAPTRTEFGGDTEIRMRQLGARNGIRTMRRVQAASAPPCASRSGPSVRLAQRAPAEQDFGPAVPESRRWPAVSIGVCPVHTPGGGNGSWTGAIRSETHRAAADKAEPVKDRADGFKWPP